MERKTPKINRKFLKSLQGDDESYQEFADRLGISRQRLNTLLNDETAHVFMRTIRIMSKNTGEPVRNFIRYVDSVLPDDPNFYESLQYGWYIDNVRQESTVDKNARIDIWLSENVQIKRSDEITQNCGRLSFRGSSFNCLGHKFDIHAELLTPHLFVARCLNQSADDDATRCWVGILNVHKKEVIDGSSVNMLFGIWSGVHVANTLGVYRWLLADRKIQETYLNKLCRSENIKVWHNFTHGSTGAH